MVRSLATLFIGAALATHQASALAPDADPAGNPADRAFDAPLAMQRLVEAQFPTRPDGPPATDAWEALCLAKLLMRETYAKIFKPDAGLSVIRAADPRVIIDPTWALYETPASLALRLAVANTALAASEAAGLDAILAELRNARGYAVPVIGTKPFDDYLNRFDVQPRHRLLFDRIRPDLAYIRPLGYGRAARMVQAARRDDWPAFVASTEDALALARVAGYEPDLIARLLGRAIDAIVTNTLVLTLAERRPPEAALVELAAAIDRQLADRPALEFHLLADQIVIREFIEAGFGGAETCSLADFARRVGESIELAEPDASRRLDRATMLRLHDDWTAWAVDYSRTPAHGRGITTAPTRLAIWALLPERRVLIEVLPETTKTFALEDLVRVRLLGCRAMVAVEIFERRFGRLPASLQELVQARLLEAIPIDPVSGAELRYARLETPDKAGRRYIIYSAGIDARDDGGRERVGAGDPPSDRSKALTEWGAGSGYDYIINSLHP